MRRKIVNALYDIGVLLALIAMLPAFMYGIVRRKKYRKSIMKRVGLGFPRIEKDGRPLIWVHAVSVGETKAVAALVERLRERGDSPRIILSVTTETGYAEGLRVLQEVDYHVYLPFDLSVIVRPLVRRCKPDMVIIVETDFWYNFLDEAKKNGAALVLVNGKISEKSFRRHRFFGKLSRSLFDLFDVMCIQGESYRVRFEQLGIPKAKLVVTGNLKLEDSYPVLSAKELMSWREKLRIAPGRPVLVVGSTHDTEEALVIEAVKMLREWVPDLYTIIVPRHPERFDSVADLLLRNGEKFGRITCEDLLVGDEDVLLVDMMGMLRQCYQLADVALVGGSFISHVGGHNILEPSWYGVPVVCGPYMFSQPDFLLLMKEYGSGVQVEQGTLVAELKNIFLDEERKVALGSAGRRLWKEEKGAVEKTLEAITDKIRFSEKDVER